MCVPVRSQVYRSLHFYKNKKKIIKKQNERERSALVCVCVRGGLQSLLLTVNRYLVERAMAIISMSTSTDSGWMLRCEFNKSTE